MTIPLRSLGNSGLRISPVGLGTWAIGGEGSIAWGPQDDSESVAAIRRGVELGINWIDTAPGYGWGRAEEMVARALENMPAGNRPMVFTKCGILPNPDRSPGSNLKRDSVRAQVEDSLKRLRAGVLDLCLIHCPAFPFDAPDPDIEEGWATGSSARWNFG